MSAPVCLIEGGADGLRVTEDGVRLLESLNEPVAVVCLAGQYRTGKSFFLNQLASHRDDLPWIADSVKDPVANGNVASGVDGATSKANGFRVGPTTESCTRGIWLWAPQPPVRNPAGQLVLFLDTEGMASTDNDESYDAKIFSLGLLLSSLFVFNTMGVIDEGAIDRLYLVSELTKHVCVSTHPATAPSAMNGFGASNPSAEEAALSSDKLEESRALAPHFPPFVWLLRDFLLDMQIDGNALTANEYLEKALDARDVSTTASESTRMRQVERNRTRASIRVLFGRRECLTLVRPVTDERDLRRAAELPDSELRREFVDQMTAVRRRLLSAVTAKELLGKTLDGPQVAQLVRCYTDTMNSGAVPDIKAAWEYVSDATCQAALAAAIELYDTLMEATTGKKPPKKVSDEGDSEDTDGVEEDTDDGSGEAEGDEPKILSQAEFEAIYKDAQEQALNLFKVRSVEGASRATCFQKLKQHMHARRTTLIAQLQKRSSRFCVKVLAKLRAKFLMRPLAAGAWDAAANKDEAFQATMEVLEEVYERKARGPAKKKAFYQFLRVDAIVFFEALFQRMASNHAHDKAEWERKQEQLQRLHENDKVDWKQQLQAKSMEIQQLLETKTHLEDKVASQAERISELQHSSQQQIHAITDLENLRNSLNQEIGQLQAAATELTRELEKTQLRLQHKEESLAKVEAEAQSTKQDLTRQVESLRATHQGEKEDWIRRAADQTAEKSMLQKQLKQAELDAQQQNREKELLDKERQQLQQLFETEAEARAQLERDYDMLHGDNDELERKLKQSAVQQLKAKQAAEREQARLEARLKRFQMQLGSLEGDREVEEVLRDCVASVVRQADEDKITTLQEERRMLQEQLGDLHEKISTLPDFYVRQIFCAPEPVSSFFDALTSVVGDPSKW
ncbi:putative guanylate-binding protein [Phytophthora cinnamomi]|uniref:putative guanylate-binding protein n=1 Tax=Phytophthora cinnamomi TaxID=4785 RepID=UPI00355A7964|nr:putative guanylate-binding protein [Phytophthora cinnamomi]